MRIIKKSNKIIKYIFHLSDIHIKEKINDELSSEYHKIFDQMTSHIELFKEDSIVVITGDIIDTYYSPDCIRFVNILFNKICSLCPLFLIKGNHDLASKRDPNMPDLLSPIVDYLKLQNEIYQLFQQELYQYENIIFGVTQLRSEKVIPCNVKNKKIIKIGLHHGQISHDQSKEIVKLTSKLSVRDFEKYYDITMLGDCHKHMFLNKSKTVAYAGTFKQSSFRDPNICGMIKWNLENKSGQFIRLINDYGYIILHVQNGKLDDYDENMIPKYSYIKIIYKNCSIEQLENIEKQLRSRHSIIEYNNERDLEVIYADAVITIGNMTKKATEINDFRTAKQLIINNIKEINNLDDQKIERINLQLDDLIKESKFIFFDNNKIFKLRSIKFDNFFAYGTNNYVNFESDNFNKKIVLLNGDNSVGKSSLIQIILYGLFGVISDNIKRHDMINIQNNNSNVNIDIDFDVNGKKYRIMRFFTKKGKSKEINEELHFYEGKKEISSVDKIKTQKNIYNLIGTYDNLIESNIILQKDATSFFDLTSFQKKSLICKLSNLDIFDEILCLTKNEFNSLDKIIPRERNKLISKLGYTNKTNLIEIETNITNKIKLLNDEIGKKLDNKNNLIIQLEQLNKQKNHLEYKLLDHNHLNSYDVNIINDKLLELEKQRDKNDIQEQINNKQLELKKIVKYLNHKKFKSIDQKKSKFDLEKNNKIQNLVNEKNDSLKNRHVADDNIDEIKQNIENYQNKINDYNIKIDTLRIQIDNINEKIISYGTKDVKKITKDNEKYIENEKFINEIQNELQTIGQELERHEKMADNLDNVKYDSKCQYCMNNRLVVEKISIVTHVNELNLLKELKNKELKNRMKKTNQYARTKYEKYIEDISKNKELMDQIEKIENQIMLISKDSEIVTKDLEKANSKKIQYDDNRKIDERIIWIDNELKDIMKSELNNYIEYLELVKNKEKLENDILVLMNVSNNMNRLDVSINQLKMDLKKIEEFKNDQSNMIKLNDEIRGIQNKIFECNEILNERQKELLKYENDLREYNSGKRDLELDIEKKNMLEIITKSIVEGGLVDKILSESIIPQIQRDVNSILYSMRKFNISFESDMCIRKIIDGKHKISKIGGFEYVAINLAFRLAFCNLQQRMKTNFLILDETFNFFDENIISNLDILLNYVRSKFEWCMVISHDNKIKHLCDSTIQIEHKNGCSFLLVR